MHLLHIFSETLGSACDTEGKKYTTYVFYSLGVMDRISPFIEAFIRYVRFMPRVMIVWYLFVGYFLFLLWTTFSYAVLDHDFFANLADKQQTMTIQNPTSRGSIYTVGSATAPQ